MARFLPFRLQILLKTTSFYKRKKVVFCHSVNTVLFKKKHAAIVCRFRLILAMQLFSKCFFLYGVRTKWDEIHSQHFVKFNAPILKTIIIIFIFVLLFMNFGKGSAQNNQKHGKYVNEVPLRRDLRRSWLYLNIRNSTTRDLHCKQNNLNASKKLCRIM